MNSWPEWIAAYRYKLPDQPPSLELLHEAIWADLHGRPRPDGVNVTVEKVVLELRWYWPIVPQEWHGGVCYEKKFSPIAGYYCSICKTTFFEATPELVMAHDCNAEAIRVKSLDLDGFAGRSAHP